MVISDVSVVLQPLQIRDEILERTSSSIDVAVVHRAFHRPFPPISLLVQPTAWLLSVASARRGSKYHSTISGLILPSTRPFRSFPSLRHPSHSKGHIDSPQPSNNAGAAATLPAQTA